MVKIHNKTGMKYLCITKKDDWQKYKGSGKYWMNHLKKHGSDIRTELIYECDDYFEFLVVCRATSDHLDVVLSEEFANIVPETGYNNNDGKPNIVLFWEYASEELKRNIIEKRRVLQKKNHWIHSEKTEEIRGMISKRAIAHWDQFDIDTRRKMTEKFRSGYESFFADEKRVSEWKRKLSESKLKYYNNVAFEVISEKNRNARLNTSEESKLARKKKIQEVYATGKHDKLFKKMSEERMGANNPAAKPITVNGVQYGSVAEASRETGMSSSKLYKMRKENEKNKVD